MQRMLQKWAEREIRLFFRINRTSRHRALDKTMPLLTRLGGAMFTLGFSLVLLISSASKTVGWQCLLAVVISHLPVAAIKKLYPRQRPYLVLPDTNICKNPLRDHSFPSGHTTAIFALTIPLCLAWPAFVPLLLLLAICVGLSRIYLGLHYPSDVAAGAGIGTAVAFGVSFVV